MNSELASKVIVITGAGRGIGRAIALEVAKEGATVVVNDLGGSGSGEGADSTPAASVVAEIEKMGGKAKANFSDVSDAIAAQALIADAIEAFGKVDAVVNNAGILRDRIFHRMTDEQFDAVVRVHLVGSYNVSRSAANHFKDQGGGAYVHMTSTSGLIGNLGQVNYGAAKMGIVGMSSNIARDMIRFGVRSNCIAPFAFSRLVGSIPAKDDNQERLDRFKQMQPEHIAPLAAYLCSDAARDVTGQIFAVRMNEIFLMSQPRPIRSVHRGEGWTMETLADHGMQALKGSFVPIENSADVFNWDPV